jgi:hypothetical protein
MKFVTHNQSNIDVNGTHFQGYIDAEYSVLKKIFGKPTSSDGYKTDAEWEILFEDGTVATIYNWKNGKNYLGREGTPKTKITHWNVGGNSKVVVEKIQEVLKSNLVSSI